MSFRERQAEALNVTFQDSKYPVILVGDLNASPDSQVLQIMASRWINGTADLKDPLTYPSQDSKVQLDYVFSQIRSQFTVEEAAVINEPLASDHRPLIVQWKLR